MPRPRFEQNRPEASNKCRMRGHCSGTFPAQLADMDAFDAGFEAG
jgi:hypothetical protein